MAKQSKKTRAEPAPPTPPPRAAPSPELRAIAEKKRRGEKLTVREQSKFDKAAREQDEFLRDQHYRTMPRRKWQLASGVSHHVMMKHAGRYGIPLADETVDVKAIANWLHTFLTDNEDALKAGKDVDLLMVGDSPALERYRNARADREEIEVAKLRGVLMPRETLRDMLLDFAGALKECGKQLENHYGPDALDMLNQAIDRGNRAAKRLDSPQT